MVWLEQLGLVVGTTLRVEKKQVESSGLRELYQGWIGHLLLIQYAGLREHWEKSRLLRIGNTYVDMWELYQKLVPGLLRWLSG